MTPSDLRTESVRCWCGHVFVHTFHAWQYPGYDYDDERSSTISGWCDRCRRSYKGRMHRGAVPPWGVVLVTAPAVYAYDAVRPHAPVVLAFGFGVLVGLMFSLVAALR